MIESLIENLVCQSSEKKIQAFRNIATCDPSQNLFDDLVDEVDYEVLQYADNLSSGIDHDVSKSSRFAQYGNISNSLLCFEENFWSWGRFGNGTFGVWYGALEEETSIKEALYHRPEIDKNDFKNAYSPIIQARRLFRATLTAKKFYNLGSYVEKYPQLLSSENYAFCQTMGAYAIQENIDMYLAPSVRNPGGTCTPVFNSEIIEDSLVRSYLNIFPLNNDLPRIASIQEL